MSSVTNQRTSYSKNYNVSLWLSVRSQSLGIYITVAFVIIDFGIKLKPWNHPDFYNYHILLLILNKASTNVTHF